MGRSRYKFQEQYYPYYVTSSVVGGLPLFMEPAISTIILEALCYLQEESKVSLNAYVIMPNHIHMIVKHEQLSAKLRSFKSFTARSIVDYLKNNDKRYYLSQLKSKKLKNHRDSEHQVWQEGLILNRYFHLKWLHRK